MRNETGFTPGGQDKGKHDVPIRKMIIFRDNMLLITGKLLVIR